MNIEFGLHYDLVLYIYNVQWVRPDQTLREIAEAPIMHVIKISIFTISKF